MTINEVKIEVVLLAVLIQAVGVWSLDYLSTKLDDAQITVDYTPDGYVRNFC